MWHEKKRGVYFKAISPSPMHNTNGVLEGKMVYHKTQSQQRKIENIKCQKQVANIIKTFSPDSEHSICEYLFTSGHHGAAGVSQHIEPGLLSPDPSCDPSCYHYRLQTPV